MNSEREECGGAEPLKMLKKVCREKQLRLRFFAALSMHLPGPRPFVCPEGVTSAVSYTQSCRACLRKSFGKMNSKNNSNGQMGIPNYLRLIFHRIRQFYDVSNKYFRTSYAAIGATIAVEIQRLFHAVNNLLCIGKKTLREWEILWSKLSKEMYREMRYIILYCQFLRKVTIS